MGKGRYYENKISQCLCCKPIWCICTLLDHGHVSHQIPDAKLSLASRYSYFFPLLL